MAKAPLLSSTPSCPLSQFPSLHPLIRHLNSLATSNLRVPLSSYRASSTPAIIQPFLSRLQPLVPPEQIQSIRPRHPPSLSLAPLPIHDLAAIPRNDRVREVAFLHSFLEPVPCSIVALRHPIPTLSLRASLDSPLTPQAPYKTHQHMMSYLPMKIRHQHRTQSSAQVKTVTSALVRYHPAPSTCSGLCSGTLMIVVRSIGMLTPI